jgi:hypothetical protein
MPVVGAEITRPSSAECCLQLPELHNIVQQTPPASIAPALLGARQTGSQIFGAGFQRLERYFHRPPGARVSQ